MFYIGAINIAVTRLPVTRMRNRYQYRFRELFSLKRIYVNYKNDILSLIDCFFRI